MNTYPTHPGYKAEGTSRESAERIAGRCRLLRDRVLESLRQGPKTPDEVASALGETVLAIRPRCTELVKLGQARKTMQRRRNTSGHNANVLEASQ